MNFDTKVWSFGICDKKKWLQTYTWSKDDDYWQIIVSLRVSELSYSGITKLVWNQNYLFLKSELFVLQFSKLNFSIWTWVIDLLFRWLNDC